jgi:hypothetical protein
MDPEHVIARIQVNREKKREEDEKQEKEEMEALTLLVETAIQKWDSSSYNLTLQKDTCKKLTKERLLTILNSINRKYGLGLGANHKYYLVSCDWCSFTIGLRRVHYKLHFYVGLYKGFSWILQTIFNFPEDHLAFVHTFDTWEAREAYIQKIEPIKNKTCVGPDGVLMTDVTRYERYAETYSLILD